MTFSPPKGYECVVTQDEDIILPHSPTSNETSPAKGRPADRIAAGLAAIGCALAVLAVIWFVWGFMAEDGWSNTTFSATILGLAVGSLGIVPLAVIATLAYKAWKNGGGRATYLWSLLLATPWVIVAALALRYAPLPMWTSLLMLIINSLLILWGCVSLVLFIGNRGSAPNVESGET